jgi:hypothetical protein
MTSLVATTLSAAAVVTQQTLGPPVGFEPSQRGFGQVFADGGIMMYPLTFCAIAVAILAGRAALRLKSAGPESGAPVRAGIDGVLFWGVYASILGVLGTVLGVFLTTSAVEAVGEVHVRLVSAGIKVALTTTIYGLLVLLGAAVLWFALRYWHRRGVLASA